MTKKEYLNWGENMQWIMVLLFCGFILITQEQHLVRILMLFVTNILIFGNARRIVSGDKQNGLMLVRRNLYVLPLLLPLAFGLEVNFAVKGLWIWILVGVGSGLLPILYKRKDWQIVLSYDLISLRPKKSKSYYITLIYIFIGAAFAEELFYRVFLITFSRSALGWFSILLSAGMFLVHHWGCKWAEESFRKSDYIAQCTLGLASAVLFYFSMSILPSFFLHLTYNVPHILVNLRAYRFHYTSLGARFSEKGQ